MVLCRSKLRLSINQIAKMMGRSTSTIHRYVKGVAVDNRRKRPVLRRHAHSKFQHTVFEIRIRMRMFLDGLASFEDAMSSKAIPLITLDWFLRSENSLGEEEEDPA